MKFKEIECPNCKRRLLADLGEDSQGMVRVWCIKCHRWVYFKDGEYVKSVKEIKRL